MIRFCRSGIPQSGSWRKKGEHDTICPRVAETHRMLESRTALSKSWIMADTFSQQKRSWLMSRVRQKDTRPELLIRSFLRSEGFRFRLHAKNLPGTPDVVLPRLRSVLFINGCFWHQHANCSRSAIPQSNRRFWARKLLRNVERDRRARKLLRKQGWSVITLWECKLKSIKTRQVYLKKLVRRLEQR
jgi:DNA mismatch endonuclease, patch repair protein